MKDQPMDDRQIAVEVLRRASQSYTGDDSAVSESRRVSLKSYNGEPYGNERKGLSQVVTREHAEAIEWAMPMLIEVFAGGKNFIEFKAVSPDDEDAAKQETDVVNHKIQNANNYYEEAYQWIKDCLMYPNGYFKVWLEEVEETETEHYQNLSDIELLQLVESGYEIVEVDQDEFGYSVKATITKTVPQLIIESIPADELLIDNNLKSLDLDQAEYVIHRVRRTYTYLVESGFDRNKLDEIGSDGDDLLNDEGIDRLIFDDQLDDDEGGEPSYWVNEFYGRMDVDGDGISEKRRITVIGDQVFDNEEDSYQPLISMAAILRQHSHPGMSVGEFVEDIQKINTTLTRMGLNNANKINTPKRYIGDNFLSKEGNTIEMLLDGESEFVAARDPTAINVEAPISILGDVLPLIQHMKEQAGVRTGINPQTSLDPDVLQKTTAGAFFGALEQTSKRAQFYVRTMAETGFKKLGEKVHRLHRETSHQSEQVKIKNQWIEVNPAEWKERKRLKVSVGLGHNNKEQDVSVISNFMQIQRELLMNGSTLTSEGLLFNALDDLVETSGKDVTRYFKQPDPPQPPPPDPNLELQNKLIDMEMQNNQMKAQLEHQKQQMQLQKDMADFEQQKHEFMAELEKFRADIDNTDADTELTQAKTLQTLAGIGNEPNSTDAGRNKRS